MSATLRIGTRGSRLAVAQASWVRERLRLHHPALHIELVTITTSGDRVTDRPLGAIGGKGLFVKEIEEALLAGTVDCAVHSMKDLPGELAPGLVLAAVPAREDARDICISRDGRPLSALAAGARIGTASLRRAALLHAMWPHVSVVSLRGNVDTRLLKLDAGELEAVVLAVAGLRRLGIARAGEQMDEQKFIPAVGQGALAVETRDDAASALVHVLEDRDTRLTTTAERAFLRRAGGSCRTPLAAHATVRGDTLILNALIASPDGARIVRDVHRGTATQADEIGTALADTLLARGGADILRALAADAAT